MGFGEKEKIPRIKRKNRKLSENFSHPMALFEGFSLQIHSGVELIALGIECVSY